jgi:predicted ArsR family transcriptional regulator
VTEERLDRRFKSVAPLLDPVRRSLYLFVMRAGREVGRDEAASAVGVGRSLAAFHLDKLVDVGLLQAGFRRLSGKSGPGAGRPAKVYRPTSKEIGVSVPPRDYELAARLLLEGMATSDRLPQDMKPAVRRMGRALGEETPRRGRRVSSPSDARYALLDRLDERGFEPTVSDDGTIRLSNCPYGALSSDYRDTVCSLNLALLEGLVDSVAAGRFHAVRDEAPGGCCVAFRPRRGRQGRPRVA